MIIEIGAVVMVHQFGAQLWVVRAPGDIVVVRERPTFDVGDTIVCHDLEHIVLEDKGDTVLCPEADIRQRIEHVRFVPKAEVTVLRKNSRPLNGRRKGARNKYRTNGFILLSASP
jgi:hypothetical protein